MKAPWLARRLFTFLIGGALPVLLLIACDIPKPGNPTATAVAVQSSPSAVPSATPSPGAAFTSTASASPTPIPTPTPTPPPDEWKVERPVRDLGSLASRFKRDGPVAVSTATPYAPPQVGDERAFWVMDQARIVYRQARARLAVVSEHAYFYLETGVFASEASLRAAADEFDRKVYPSVIRDFGPMDSPGIDGDPRIVIFVGRLSGVAGYQSNADLYPRGAHPFSNEAEIIYVSGTGGNIGSESFGALLTHEFQHLVRGKTLPVVDSWVSEGSSELAVQLAGYRTPSTLPSFLGNPDLSLTQWSEDSARLGAHYGASYLFMRYFAERLGTTALVGLRGAAGRGADLFDNYLERIGRTERFDGLFVDWATANYLDAAAILGGRFGYRGLDLPAAATTRLGPAPRVADTVSQYGARYYTLPPSSAAMRLDFKGETAARLLPVPPRSGARFWWGNRGDSMDSRLTREFDLTQVASASLRFWTWYDLEQSYDYGYVAVSSDDGATWRTLPGKGSTEANPAGNNLGAGFTGRSGGGESPAWVEQVLDLSPYAGSKVQVRFEYVTDDGFNGRGFAVDDVAVPEIGFRDDAESDAGWRAEGFVRSDNSVPQSYAVRVVRKGQTPSVQELKLDASGSASVTLPATRAGEEVALVVAAMAPLSVERASYTLSLGAVSTLAPGSR